MKYFMKKYFLGLAVLTMVLCAKVSLQGQIIANSCPSGTGDLTTHVSSPVPPGTVVTWHTGVIASTANQVANPQAAPPGTYYAAFYDAINMCFSPTSTTPVYVANCAINTCPAVTVNLTTRVTSTPPAGSVVTWHTGAPATSANQVSNPAAVGAGTYFAAYYDAANLCYSPVSTPVVVSITTCSCPNVQVTNTCPSNTVDLTTHTSGTPPAGTIVTWHTGTTATSANQVPNPAAVGAGVYYAAFYDAVNMCYSPTSCAGVQVTITTCNQPPVANNDSANTLEDNPVTFPVTANDTDPDGTINPATLDLDPATAGVQTSFTVSGQGTFVANPVTGAVTFTPVANYSGNTTPITYSVCDNGTPVQCSSASIAVAVQADTVAKLKVKVLLQGALLGTTGNLMRDDLRNGGYLPLTEPYTALSTSNPRFLHKGTGGGETTTTAVLNANAGTADAIVDWVFVELRSAADSTQIIETRSALLQRDGDVVSPSDGQSMLTFAGKVGQLLFVSVKHRNHLGVMVARPSLFNNDSTKVDFTTLELTSVYNRPGTINYEGVEMVVIQGKNALWAANANANNKVKYQGVGNDNAAILTQVLTFPGNTAGFYNYNLAFGYFSGDVNMDGKVKYQGAANDSAHIFTNAIGLYNTLNTLGLYNYDLFLEQLP